jgi:uncharacterized protein (TIRG00374 family)
MKRAVNHILLIMVHLSGFVILYFVVRNLDWNTLLFTMQSFPTWKFLVGLGILIMVYLLKAFRWNTLNKSFGIPSSLKEALVYYLAAGFLSVITPGRLGEFAKIYFVQGNKKVDVATATSSVLLDRIWDVFVLTGIGGISLAWLMVDRISAASILVIVIVFLFSLALLLMPSILFRPLIRLSGKWKRLQKALERIYFLWFNYRHQKMLLAFAISLLAFILLAFIPFLFSAGTAYEVPYLAGVSSVSISNLLSFLPITIAGFGTRELIFSEVWSGIGHPGEIAISISLAYFAITYLGTFLLGGITYLFHFRRLYRIRDLKNRGKTGL